MRAMRLTYSARARDRTCCTTVRPLTSRGPYCCSTSASAAGGMKLRTITCAGGGCDGASKHTHSSETARDTPSVAGRFRDQLHVRAQAGLLQQLLEREPDLWIFVTHEL